MGADQKGAPVEVMASSGKVNTSWAILGGRLMGLEGGWEVWLEGRIGGGLEVGEET